MAQNHLLVDSSLNAILILKTEENPFFAEFLFTTLDQDMKNDPNP